MNYMGCENMLERTSRDNQVLIDFWDKAFSPSEEMQAAAQNQVVEEWKELAPSEKLFQAASSLGRRKKVLDFGCGDAWASIIAAKSGCKDVTAVDAASGAVQAARLYTVAYGVEENVHVVCGTSDWLENTPSNMFDGLICSNVLDVIPSETVETLLRDFARIVTQDADVIIGLNYYLSSEVAAAKGMVLTDGNRLYVNGVLRLVSRTDEEWKRLFTSWYSVERLEYFAWPGEEKETRRLFWLQKREDV